MRGEAEAWIGAALDRAFGLGGARLSRAPRGHTNQGWVAERAGTRWFVRRGFAGKPAAQADREAALLGALARTAPGLPVPRLVPTRQGAAYLVDEAGRQLHVFAWLPGEPSLGWRGPPSEAQVRSAFALLAAVHRALAALPIGAADPLTPFFARAAALDWAAIDLSALPDLEARRRALAAAVDATLARAAALPLGPPQWTHGDVHLENLLFDGDRAAALCDFDDAAPATAGLELTLALYAAARDGAEEAAFTYDPHLVAAGLDAYAGAGGDAAALAVARHLTTTPDGARLFCLGQVLIHLRAAQRGLWRLAPGIGVGACARSLLCR